MVFIFTFNIRKVNHSGKDKNYLNYVYFLLALFPKHLFIILVKEFN